MSLNVKDPEAHRNSFRWKGIGEHFAMALPRMTEVTSIEL